MSMPDLDKAAGVIDALDAYAAGVMDENRIWLAKIIVQELHNRGLLLPEGFVAVPREPTEAMIEAYFETCRRFGFHAHINATTAWEAMIQAQGERG